MKVHAWDPITNAPGITPMVTVNCDPTANYTQTDAAGIAAIKAGAALFMSNIFPDSLGIFDASRLASLFTQGPKLDQVLSAHATLFKQLRNAGALPCRIVLDFEKSPSTYHLAETHQLPALLGPLFANTVTRLNMPLSLQAYGGGEFASDRGAIIAWNRWASMIVRRAMQVAVRDLAESIFNASIPVSNYGDFWGIANDVNGWPITALGVGNESSPALYLHSDSRFPGTVKDSRWNQLIFTLNLLRIAVNAGSVVPWIGTPFYRGDALPQDQNPWLWEEQIDHINAMGIHEMILFNPSRSQAENELAADKLSSLDSFSPSGNWPMIAMDADSISTGKTYTQYVDFKQNDGSIREK